MIFTMEYEILNKLEYNLLIVTPLYIFSRLYFVTANGLKEFRSQKYSRLFFAGLFLIELSTLEYGMAKYPPSIIASAGLLIARKVLDFEVNWPKDVINRYFSLDTILVSECAKDMCALVKHERTSSLSGLRQKFSKEEFGSVYLLFNKDKK